MNALSKTLLVVAIVSCVVAGHQAREASRLQAEGQRLSRDAIRLIVPATPSPEHIARRHRRSGEDTVGKPARLLDPELRRLVKMADNGMHEYHVDFFLVEKGPEGLSAKAAAAAGLTEAQTKKVDGILRRIWDEGVADFASRAELVEEESGEGTGRMVYMIPARADRGWKFKDQLLADLEDAVGPDKRAFLMRGYQNKHFLGGYGARDIRLEFLADEKRFTFAYLNPISGEAEFFGSDPLEEFRDQFGDSFEIPSVAAPENRKAPAGQ